LKLASGSIMSGSIVAYAECTRLMAACTSSMLFARTVAVAVLPSARVDCCWFQYMHCCRLVLQQSMCCTAAGNTSSSECSTAVSVHFMALLVLAMVPYTPSASVWMCLLPKQCHAKATYTSYVHMQLLSQSAARCVGWCTDGRSG
jgi:hypothetical protein